MTRKISIIIPAKNEAKSLVNLLPALQALSLDAEIVVVNDGSTDDTQQVCQQAGVTTVNHPYSKGNGAGQRATVIGTIQHQNGALQHNRKKHEHSSTTNLPKQLILCRQLFCCPIYLLLHSVSPFRHDLVM